MSKQAAGTIEKFLWKLECKQCELSGLTRKYKSYQEKSGRAQGPEREEM